MDGSSPDHSNECKSIIEWTYLGYSSRPYYKNWSQHKNGVLQRTTRRRISFVMAPCNPIVETLESRSSYSWGYILSFKTRTQAHTHTHTHTHTHRHTHTHTHRHTHTHTHTYIVLTRLHPTLVVAFFSRETISRSQQHTHSLVEFKYLCPSNQYNDV